MTKMFCLSNPIKSATLAAVLSAALFGGSASAQTTADQALVDRGRSISTGADCMACHTVPHGTKPFAGGYPIVSPLGTIFSTNITPSTTYGIGSYSETDFDNAVRHGVRRDGAHLYPAMPYSDFAAISDDDMHALYAYFMHGVSPVDEPALNETALPFPFDLRFSMTFWNLLYANKGPFKPDPAVSDEINRGAYIAGALGHCSTCHSPRGILMGEESSKFLAGGDVGPWYAPNITSDPISGIGGWSIDELVQYFRTGHIDGKNQAAGGMAEAVQNSLQHLPQSDLQALAVYLKSVPPVRDPGETVAEYSYGRPTSAESAIRGTSPQSGGGSLDSGAKIFSGNCASCHQADGAGARDQSYPSLFHNTATGASQAKNLLAAIIYGVEREVDGKTTFMPGFGKQSFASPLTDQQIVDVSNYVLANFGNPAVKVTITDVAISRAGGPVPFLGMVQPFILPAMIGVIVLLALLLVGWRLFRKERDPVASTA